MAQERPKRRSFKIEENQKIDSLLIPKVQQYPEIFDSSDTKGKQIIFNLIFEEISEELFKLDPGKNYDVWKFHAE